MMQITVVVPFSRPENWGRVLENFSRQRHPHKRLVIAANGRASNTAAPSLPFESGVIQSGSSPSLARNAGLALVRASGGGPVSFWDDDDYYGPQYLSEVADNLVSGSVTVKFFRYVRWDDGLHYCLAPEPAYPTCGATLSGFAEELPDWPDCKHEDMMYAPALFAAGLKLKKLPPWGFVYDRRSNASRECAAKQLAYLAALGPAIRLTGAPDSASDIQRVPHGEHVPLPSWDDVMREAHS